MYQRDQNNSLFLGGERTTGQDVRASNGKWRHVVVFFFWRVIWQINWLVCVVLAAASIANIVKSSLGPVGLDKMLVDEIGVSVHLRGINLFRNQPLFFFLYLHRMLQSPTTVPLFFNCSKWNTPLVKCWSSWLNNKIVKWVTVLHL